MKGSGYRMKIFKVLSVVMGLLGLFGFLVFSFINIDIAFISAVTMIGCATLRLIAEVIESEEEKLKNKFLEVIVPTTPQKEYAEEELEEVLELSRDFLNETELKNNPEKQENDKLERLYQLRKALTQILICENCNAPLEFNNETDTCKCDYFDMECYSKSNALTLKPKNK